MRSRFTRWLFTAALCLGLAAPAQPAAAHETGRSASAARFADDHSGYHLRPPYFIAGLGWHRPPRGHYSRAYYFGYHFHEPAKPLVLGRTKARSLVVHRPKRRESSAHQSWCAARHRSYRPSDNTFVGRDGCRRGCRSPYGGGSR